MQSRVADGLYRAGLLVATQRVREELLVFCASELDSDPPDGLPLPPARMRVWVAGRSGDAEAFLQIGAQMCDAIRDALAAAGTPIEQMGSVLDFGCGCGRVARHWSTAGDGPELHGCDYNPKLTAWCSANLPAMRTATNQLVPPTPYPGDSFDLIYALSVFSHLDGPLQEEWLAEFRRLLRPGGVLVLSVLGEQLRSRLRRAERRRFDRGELVVRRPGMAGRNLCSAFHPHPYVEGSLLADFKQVTAFDLGSSTRPIHQQGYLARL